MQKIIFFDIDGTILSHRTNQITESTKTAIRQAKANGHLVFINSGRTFAEIDHRVKEIGFDGYVCGCGTYISYQDKVLLHASLPKNICKRIVQDLRKYNIDAVLEGTKSIYFDNSIKLEPLHEQRLRFINDYHFDVKSWDDPDLLFDKFCIWYDDAESCRHFLQGYLELFDYIDREDLHEFVPKGYSKASGIEYLLTYLNLPHENTYAIGDGANDLPMLSYVKNSIGMGNSDGGVPEIVSFLTKDVDDEGIAHALKHFHII